MAVSTTAHIAPYTSGPRRWIRLIRRGHLSVSLGDKGGKNGIYLRGGSVTQIYRGDRFGNSRNVGGLVAEPTP